MSDINTLEKIKKREESAEKEVNDAKERAAHIIADAKKKSDELAKEAEARAEKAYDAAIKSAKAEAAKRAGEIMQQQKDRIAALKSVGEADAADIFGDVLLEEFGA